MNAMDDLQSPFRLILSPTSWQDEDEKNVLDAYEKMQALPIRVAFDAETKEFSFDHEVNEVESIIAALKLYHIFSSNLSLLGSPLELTRCFDASDGPNYMIKEDQSDAFCERLADLKQKATAFYKMRQVIPCVRVCDMLENPVELLHSHRGLVVGEVHNDCAARRFLIQNLPTLRAQGITTLFLEHFCYDSFQHVLDHYMASDGETLPEPLHTYAQSLDLQFHSKPDGSVQELLKASKRHGIRVVGLDTTLSYSAGLHRKLGVEDESARYLAMNYVAVQIIERVNAPKYVGLVGNGHVGTVMPQIPGIADLLGQPSLVIQTGKANESKLSRNVTCLHRQIKQVSLYLELPDSSERALKVRKIE
jgi:hypothetical protein